MARPAEIAAGFAYTLRGEGIAVPATAVANFHEALGVVGIDSKASVYWAGRATLITRPESFDTYDRCFDRFWLARTKMVEAKTSIPSTMLIVTDDLEDPASQEEDAEYQEVTFDQVLALRYSEKEVLRDQDFSKMNREELVIAMRMIQLFRWSPPLRSSFRRVANPKGNRVDLRKTIRKSLSAGGEATVPEMMDRTFKRRKVVFLCDVSGSMEPYSRPLLHLAHSAVLGAQRVEVFTMATRLTRITRQLQSKDPERALKDASEKVVDFSGGTRLGELIKSFNDHFAIRGMARRAIVVISSDGWDRGDPEVMSREMQRLHRVAHKVIWINPLKAMPGYAPLARGMAAAFPFIDSFLEGHSVAALEALVKEISK